MMPELSSSGVPQDQVAILVRIYREAAAKLRAILITPPGKTASAQAFNAGRAAEQLRQIEDAIAQLRAAASNWNADARDASDSPVLKAARDGIALADRQARDAGVRPKDGLGGSFSLIDPRTVEVFARKIAFDLGKAANAMGERAKQVLRTTAQLKLSEVEINQILAGGVLSGKPVETIRQLREALKAVHGETVPIKTKNGNVMNFEVGYYASMVARTQTRTATVAARHERLQELDLDLVAIVGLLSKNFCTAFLGQVFSLSGKSAKYPALASLPGGGPPFHPFCSKSTRPFIEELASGKQLDQAEGLADAHKLLELKPDEAQRAFKDQQIYQQQKDRYASTAKELFGATTKK